jgi:hypothetical protein
MDRKLKSGFKWLGEILLTSVVGYILDKVGFIGLVSNYFGGRSKGMIAFFNYSIPLWEVILLFIVFSAISYFLRTKVLFKPKSSLITRQEKLYELVDEFKIRFKYMQGPLANGIEYKTHITMSNGNIILERIEPYCVVNHNPKLLMKYESPEGYGEPVFICPDDDCLNSTYYSDVDKVQLILYSELEHEWDKAIATNK